MIAGGDSTMIETGRVKLADMFWGFSGNRQAEHLIEITVIERPVPTDRQRGAAHHAGGGGRIECRRQARHIVLVIPAFDEKFQEPADGHIREGIEPREFETVAAAQFMFEACFCGCLRGRQKGADGIVDQGEGEATVRPAIALVIELANGFDRLLEDTLAPLRICLRRVERGERGHNFDLVGSQEFRKIRLRWHEQHSEVAPIHDMPTERAGTFDQPSKIGIELRGASGEIDGRDIGPGQCRQTLFSCFGRHALPTIRAGIDVAVTAGLVTDSPDVELEGGDAGGVEWH